MEFETQNNVQHVPYENAALVSLLVECIRSERGFRTFLLKPPVSSGKQLLGVTTDKLAPILIWFTTIIYKISVPAFV